MQNDSKSVGKVTRSVQLALSLHHRSSSYTSHSHGQLADDLGTRLEIIIEYISNMGTSDVSQGGFYGYDGEG